MNACHVMRAHWRFSWFGLVWFYHSSGILGMVLTEDGTDIVALDRVRLWGKERNMKTKSVAVVQG